MSGARIEVGKFDGRGDYTMWKEKLLAHSNMLGLSSVLREAETPMGKERDSEKSDEEEKEEREKMEAFEEKKRKARSTIVLSISDRVLRKIKKETTAAAMLEALDRLYMSKALPNRIYLKQKLYSFKMSENLSIEGNIDEFLHIVAHLENLNVLVFDEDQAILLLMSLPKPFDQLKDTLKYSSGKIVLSLDEVTTAIYSKELVFGSVKKSIKGQAEGLYVKDKAANRGRSEQKEKGKGKRSKSNSKRGCWICGEDGHLKSTCPNKNKPQFKNQGNNKGESSGGKGNLVEASVNFVEAARMFVSEALSSTDIHLEDKWIMHIGCSYHMTHKREWLEDFDEEAGGSVRMGNKTISRVKELVQSGL